MKKQKLVTNQRDKDLLIFLGIIIVIFLLYNYAISPAIEKGSMLKEEVNNSKTELATSNDLVDQYSSLVQEEQNTRKTISNKYSMFLFEINQERILYKLDTLIANSGLPVASYSNTTAVASPIVFPTPTYTPITYPLLDLASKVNPSLALAATTAAIDATSGEAIMTTDIILNFNNSSYETAMSFMKSIEEMDKSVIVRNVALSKTETGIDGQLILAFYSLPQIDNAVKDPLEFGLAVPQGKANPFN